MPELLLHARRIDIGKPSWAVPVTPPCVRGRTRRFGWLHRRPDNQSRQAKRLEIGIRHCKAQVEAACDPPRTMWAVGGSGPLLTSAARLPPSGIPDAMQTSRGKFDCLPRTPAEFAPRPFAGFGLCRLLPTRPVRAASDPVSVRQAAVLLRTSFRRHLAMTPLCFATLHHHQAGRGLTQTCSAYEKSGRPLPAARRGDHTG